MPPKISSLHLGQIDRHCEEQRRSSAGSVARAKTKTPHFIQPKITIWAGFDEKNQRRFLLRSNREEIDEDQGSHSNNQHFIWSRHSPRLVDLPPRSEPIEVERDSQPKENSQKIHPPFRLWRTLRHYFNIYIFWSPHIKYWWRLSIGQTPFKWGNFFSKTE